MANSHFRKHNGFNDCDRLPESYGYTQVTLIARDPHWIYAYWDISPEELSRIQKSSGDDGRGSSVVLRMYDVTLVNFNGTNANSSFDIDVGSDKRSWYINLWSDNVSYCCDLGVRGSNGHFRPLARSNVVTTQRREWVNRFEAQWAEVKPGKNGEPIFVPESSAVAALSTPAMSPHLPPKHLSQPETQKPIGADQLTPTLRERVRVKKRYRKPLSVDEILAYYSRLFPRLRRTKPKLIERLKKKGLLEESLNGNGNGNGVVKEISPFEKDLFFKKVRFGASAEFEEKGAASEQNQKGGASESLLGGSSELNYRGRKFFFELGAELIVYGRTEPDATVYWGNQKIHLRPDGTFSLRLALPDGHIPLDFVAKSADKIEQRRIATAVERFPTVHSTRISP